MKTDFSTQKMKYQEAFISFNTEMSMGQILLQYRHSRKLLQNNAVWKYLQENPG